MNAEIIAVGSELLLGQIVNTNAQFLSSQLAEMGINVYYHTVVGDNSLRLKSVLEIAEKRSDFIIFTGGLGPTKDDLTKETISKHLRKNLVMDDEALRHIEEFFNKTNRVMTENNRKQALIIEDSLVLKNDYGMAPGMLLEKNKHLYMLLPGPPSEMNPMFLAYGKKAIWDKLGVTDHIVSRVLRFFGIGEAMLEAEIEEIIEEQSNPTIAPLAGEGEVTLRITAKHESIEMANQLIDETERKIMEKVGDHFYGYGGTTLMKELFKEIEAKGLTISCAESLTGGLFQEEFTSIPGAGNFLKGGVVCYTNEVKEKILQVKRETLDQDGAVSASCALQLAENVAKLLNTDIGISFTGVAGPDELEGKPVGTVYVGIYIKGEGATTCKLTLAGSREAIRMRSSKYGSYLLLKRLEVM